MIKTLFLIQRLFETTCLLRILSAGFARFFNLLISECLGIYVAAQFVLRNCKTFLDENGQIDCKLDIVPFQRSNIATWPPK